MKSMQALVEKQSESESERKLKRVSIKVLLFYLASLGEKFMLSGMTRTEPDEVNEVEGRPSGKTE
jgi:hypothetical protein